eukprot:TRINITY_DN33910_c0_g1_i2.p1 TRINITY_DN33910_c0_g1~~TRINITY_DN33910_c0_g1_i2.p1  ORF type:complete len:660 (-),score=149.62 TRINITY_DN33910_c0_g1_i2:53-2032(-)
MAALGRRYAHLDEPEEEAEVPDSDAQRHEKLEEPKVSPFGSEGEDEQLHQSRLGQKLAAFDDHRELESLRTENAELRDEVQQLRKENTTLRERVEESICVRMLGRKSGAAQLRYCPRDLWIIYSAKWAECSAYFGFAYIFIAYLSDDFEMSDQEAGALYAWYGFLSTLVGLVGGVVIDKLGVRRSMLVGTTMATLARGISFYTTSKYMLWFANVIIAPVGAAFGIPVMAISVRRYTHERNRAYGFSFFYGALNLGNICGAWLINLVRDSYPDGIVLASGFRVSWLRMVVGWASLLTFYTVIASFFVRDIQVLSDRPLEERAYCSFKPATSRLKEAVKECAGTPRFWRLVAVTFIFCGVRTAFRHLDATFPKYFMRLYGPTAPFEIIVLINPVVAMIFSPVMTGLLLKYKCTLAAIFIGGSFVSGSSTLTLVVSESPFSAVMFVLILSVGECIWSPKLYEFSTMAAPEGREGMYVALTFAPVYLSSFFTGFISGWALENFCPKNNPEARNTRLMWLLIGVTTMASPFCMLLFRSCLFVDEDKAQTNEEVGEGEQRPQGRFRLPQYDVPADSPAALEDGTLHKSAGGGGSSIEFMRYGKSDDSDDENEEPSYSEKTAFEASKNSDDASESVESPPSVDLLDGDTDDLRKAAADDAAPAPLA